MMMQKKPIRALLPVLLMLFGCDNAMEGSADASLVADANPIQADAMDPVDAGIPELTPQIAVGSRFSCAVNASKKVYCWGRGRSGQVGSASTNLVQRLSSAEPVSLGGDVQQVVAGHQHACALMTTGAVRCWGNGADGRLGYGNEDNIGDDELPSSVGVVDIGGRATQLAAGRAHTCALLDTGFVRCWGSAGNGRLGYGNEDNIGDDEPPASAGNINISETGSTAVYVTAGDRHTCALLGSGELLCWGSGTSGKLGYGNLESVLVPAQAGAVDLGGIVTDVAAGANHTCAVVDGKAVCWGSAAAGKLGYGAETTFGMSLGDNEAPTSAGFIDVGFDVKRIVAGLTHTCALSTLGEARCWGSGANGKLGYGNIDNIGDDERPASVGSIDLGGTASKISIGEAHSCAVLMNGEMRCWGDSESAALGYDDSLNDIGDDEVPAVPGDIPLPSL